MLYLIRYAEIGKEPHPEKSKLEKDIVASLESRVSSPKIKKDIGRIFLETEKDETETIKQIHGIASFSPCLKCSLEELDAKVIAFAEKELKDKRSFGVKVKRVGMHPFTSQEKSAKLGEKILEKLPHLKVNLKTPDEMIFVEIRGTECYIFHTVIPGIDKRMEHKKQVISEPRFIVDDMLGKLAVRLRMLGFDTSFYRDTADSFLLRKSKEENRILLTRDTGLTKVRGANAFFISSKKLKDQIREVIEKYDLKISPPNMFSRCSVCNEPLEDLPKEKVKGKVPPVVFKLFKEFAYCPKCDKYYWKGTHYEKIIEELRDFIS
jgi:uncharacterized protein with PIN domain/tRNA(Ser,Leu) C12 N-acetylase TAN1